MRVMHGVLAGAAIMLAACGKKPEAAQAPAADTARTMGGMQMPVQGMQIVAMMPAHLDSLATMAPTQMTAMMAAHEVLASRMMDAMGADMRGMNIESDSAWTALGDSLRRDLAELPGLSDGSLTTRMQAHIGRMRRMMAMHEGMMRK